jgi:hypothetical protein
MNGMANKSAKGEGPVIDYGVVFVDDDSLQNTSEFDISLVYNETAPLSLAILSHTILQAICM